MIIDCQRDIVKESNFVNKYNNDSGKFEKFLRGKKIPAFHIYVQLPSPTSRLKSNLVSRKEHDPLSRSRLSYNKFFRWQDGDHILPRSNISPKKVTNCVKSISSLRAFLSNKLALPNKMIYLIFFITNIQNTQCFKSFKTIHYQTMTGLHLFINLNIFHTISRYIQYKPFVIIS